MKRIVHLIAAVAVVAALTGAVRARDNAGPFTDPGAPGYSWPAADVDRDGVFDRLDHCPGTPRGVDVDAHGCSMAQAARHAESPSALEHKLLTEGYLRLDRVYFATDRSQLHPRAEDVLLEVAEIIRAHPRLKFEVSGHADERGEAAYNESLSQLRAHMVQRFLTERGGVRPLQIVARGHGEREPVASGRSARALHANRRVEFRLLNPEALPRGARLEPPAQNLALFTR